MTTKEQSRVQVLTGMLEGHVTVAGASGLMGVSERHTWRLLAAYRKDGAAAVATRSDGEKVLVTNRHVLAGEDLGNPVGGENIYQPHSEAHQKVGKVPPWDAGGTAAESN